MSLLAGFDFRHDDIDVAEVGPGGEQVLVTVAESSCLDDPLEPHGSELVRPIGALKLRVQILGEALERDTPDPGSTTRIASYETGLRPVGHHQLATAPTPSVLVDLVVGQQRRAPVAANRDESR